MSEEVDPLALGEDDANAFWLMFGAVLVFFMQAGFAMLEVGSVGRSSMNPVLLKNVFDASISGLTWWGLGYGLAFGSDAFASNGSNGFVGRSGYFYVGEGSGDDASPLTNTPSAKSHGRALWFFQWAFAGVAATIVSGAIAGRVKFRGYICSSCVLTGFVYPIVVHLAWSSDGKFSAFRENRLVGGCGVIDFAGSGVVHATGGVAALVAAIITRNRKKRFPKEKDDRAAPTNVAEDRGEGGKVADDDDEIAPSEVDDQDIPGTVEDESAVEFQAPESYGIIFQSLGTLILWVGWYAFNGVSTLAVTEGSAGVAAVAMMNTTIAAATGCLASTAVAYYMSGYRPHDVNSTTEVLDPVYTNNGILAALVAITAGCSVVNSWGAFWIGLISSPIYYGASRLVYILKIDDVVDAFAVHGACGIWGVLAAPIFATEYYYARAYYSARADDCAGIFYGGDGGSLGAACLFLLVLFAWVGSTMSITFGVLKYGNFLDLHDMA